MTLAVKNPPASAGDVRDTSSIPGSGRFPWRRARPPTPVFLPGESPGQRSLEGYSPRSPKESDTAEVTWHTQKARSSGRMLAREEKRPCGTTGSLSGARPSWGQPPPTGLEGHISSLLRTWRKRPDAQKHKACLLEIYGLEATLRSGESESAQVARTEGLML